MITVGLSKTSNKRRVSNNCLVFSIYVEGISQMLGCRNKTEKKNKINVITLKPAL